VAVVPPNGKKARQITVDARDKDQIPKIIRRERKRHGLPPLSDEEITALAGAYTITAVENPLVQISLSVSFAYLRHAMMKIAYELAFMWLGEDYLTDPLAIELSAAIRNPDVSSTDRLAGYVGEAENCDCFNKFWTPHGEHHLAYANIVTGKAVVVCVRIFDIYAAAIAVSQDPGRYVRSIADRTKIRFLAIDAVSGRTIDTAFDEESRRIAAAMTTSQCLPPFPDPLALLDK
jgi:hypothetical protein